MPSCKRILVPVDLADFSPRIVPYVRKAAETFQAEVHLLFVERPLKEVAAGQVPDIAVTRKFEEEALREAEEQLRAIAREHLSACPRVIARVQVGHAARKIMEYVRAERIDLIILGTHGKRAMEHLMFGSIAEEVLKRSTVPVLAMNPFKVRRPKNPFDFSSDGDESSQEELEQYES